MTWDELKLQGSNHYKTGTEPIDLYRAGGMFKHFALCSIIKYAFRSRLDGADLENNMTKIIHFAELVKAEANDR